MTSALKVAAKGYAVVPVRTGFKIKREAPLPCVLPCGYTLVENGYIPDADGVSDREYMRSFHRYTPDRPPFACPAGDAMAEAAVQTLEKFGLSHSR